MPIVLALFLAAAGVSSDTTSWMRPDAFHLAIGMPRADALRALRSWSPKPGRDENEIVVDYSGERALTLEFRNDRLRAVRFELFVLLPEVRKAFAAERAYLLDAYGEPRKATKSVLVYDNTLPNIMVVVADDPTTEQGKRGVGVLAVRYYDPR